MPFQATVLQVMTAAPGDVTIELQIIRDILAEWNAVNATLRKTVLLPIGWKTHSSPAMGERAQAFINRQVLKDADILVGVFWTRLGTATGAYPSGTVEEIEEHIKTGKPTMLYFSSVPVSLESVDRGQYDALVAFREKCKAHGLCGSYGEAVEFREQFRNQLQLKLNQANSLTAEVQYRANLPSPGGMPLSKLAQKILKAASEGGTGHIRQISNGLTLEIHAFREAFKSKTGEERAELEAAISELETNDLANRVNKNILKLTSLGYKAAELLKE